MLNKKKKYLQIALNSTLEDARDIISRIPLDDRIIIEAGTPLIKRYGVQGIQAIKRFWSQKVFSPISASSNSFTIIDVYKTLKKQKKENFLSSNRNQTQKNNNQSLQEPYIVADLKCMDRGLTEVEIAQRGGASGVTALGQAPTETLNAFVEKCEDLGLDSMIDMMNVEHPVVVLRKLKKLPKLVMLHRGVDEEDYNKEKQIPFYAIQRIKSNYDIMVSVAGGDDIQEVQRAIFNDADIVVLWRDFYRSNQETAKIAQEFLKEIR